MPESVQEMAKVLRGKLRKVAEEFARGEINNEQFHTLYERYQAQLNLLALAPDSLSLKAMTGQEETVAIRSRLMARALSMAVYHHSSGLLIENIGGFNQPLADLIPVVNQLVAAIKAGKQAEPRVQPAGEGYILFVPGHYSTALMVFDHEPIIRQVASVQEMHDDFEIANQAVLSRERPEDFRLASPFFSFVMRSLHKKP